MKKLIIVLAILVSILSLNKSNQVIIPKESIRFRIIANSNAEDDQQIKKQIINNLSTKIVENSKATNIIETRNYIKESLPIFNEIVQNTLNDNNVNRDFKINYGYNYFPKKVYKNVVYEEGEYESLVITLGEGKGDNFWCVLFPPLCLVDDNNENVEYKSLIKEIIDKYF